MSAPDRLVSDDVEQQLRQYLAILARCGDVRPNGYAYRNLGDFLLQRGRWFAPHPFPPRLQRGQLGLCFQNAFILAVRSRGRLRYCEGIAAGIIPMEHAWCIDADDRVVDPTWRDDDGVGYIGVVVPLDAVRAVRKRGTTSALFDWQAHFPLLKVGGL